MQTTRADLHVAAARQDFRHWQDSQMDSRPTTGSQEALTSPPGAQVPDQDRSTPSRAKGLCECRESQAWPGENKALKIPVVTQGLIKSSERPKISLMFGHRRVRQSAQRSARGRSEWHRAGRGLGPHQSCKFHRWERALLPTHAGG